MRLHEEPDIFKDAVSLTAEYLRLPEIYVEKDYWVTLALHRIFTSPLAEFVVFKGGTALAKCHSFIKCFSEGRYPMNRWEEGVCDDRNRHK